MTFIFARCGVDFSPRGALFAWTKVHATRVVKLLSRPPAAHSEGRLYVKAHSYELPRPVHHLDTHARQEQDAFAVDDPWRRHRHRGRHDHGVDRARGVSARAQPVSEPWLQRDRGVAGHAAAG